MERPYDPRFSDYRDRPRESSDTRASGTRKPRFPTNTQGSAKQVRPDNSVYQAPPYKPTEDTGRVRNRHVRSDELEGPPAKRTKPEGPPRELFAAQLNVSDPSRSRYPAVEGRNEDVSPPSAVTDSKTASPTSSPPQDQANKDGPQVYFNPYLIPRLNFGHFFQHILNLAPRTEATPANDSGSGCEYLRKVCNIFMSKLMKRPEIDEVYLKAQARNVLERLAASWNVMSAVICGLLSDQKYGSEEWWRHHTPEGRAEIMQPGVVFSAWVVEQLYDDNVMPDDLSRMNSPFARATAKERRCAIIQVDGEEAQVLFGTSFGDSGKAAARTKGKCFRLVNSGEDVPDVDDEGLLIFRPLEKATFMHYNRKHWVNMMKMPLKLEGRLTTLVCRRAATTMDLRKDHPFRAKAGIDPAKKQDTPATNGKQTDETEGDDSGVSGLEDNGDGGELEPGELRG